MSPVVVKEVLDRGRCSKTWLPHIFPTNYRRVPFRLDLTDLQRQSVQGMQRARLCPFPHRLHLLRRPSPFTRNSRQQLYSSSSLKTTKRVAQSACKTRLFEMTSPPESSGNNKKKSTVLVMGAGNFGSCLADHLGDSEHDVLLWSRSAPFVEHFNKHHKNPEYLTDHDFPHCIHAIGPDLPSAQTLIEVDVLLFAIPTEALR